MGYVELDDDLEDDADRVGVDTVAVALEAVKTAVEAAEARARTSAVMRQVADRLKATDPAGIAAFEDGARWARDDATLRQLRDLADFGILEEIPEQLLGRPWDLMMDEPEYRREFSDGALAVWEEVSPLL